MERIVCPLCRNTAEVTYEEDRIYKFKCSHCNNTILHEDVSLGDALNFFKRMIIADDEILSVIENFTFEDFNQIVADNKKLLSEREQLFVSNLEIKDGKIDLSLQGERGKQFVYSLVQFYLQNGGENYFMIDISTECGDSLTLTIQNNHKEETPITKLNRLEAENAELRELLGLAFKDLTRACTYSPCNSGICLTSECKGNIMQCNFKWQHQDRYDQIMKENDNG